MKPSEECKMAGLSSLKELAALSGKSKETLVNWHKKNKPLFDATLRRCVDRKRDYEDYIKN